MKGAILLTCLIGFSFGLDMARHERQLIKEREREMSHARFLREAQRKEERERIKHNLSMQELSYRMEKIRAREVRIKGIKGIVGNALLLSEGVLVSGDMTPLGRVDVQSMKVGDFYLNPWIDLPVVQYQASPVGGAFPPMPAPTAPPPPPPPPPPPQAPSEMQSPQGPQPQTPQMGTQASPPQMIPVPQGQPGGRQ